MELREIKFRAYADGKMFNNVGVVGNIIVLEYDSCEDDYGVDLELNYYGLNDDSIKLMQFTGLHDKNGKEIYEGDILSTDLSRPYLVVEFRNGCFMYQCHDSGKDYYDIMLPIDAESDQDIFAEVIGNIYSNRELLKEELK